MITLTCVFFLKLTSSSVGLGCHTRDQGPDVSQINDILCNPNSAGLLVSSSGVHDQLFTSSGDHSLGKFDGHPVDLQKVQLQTTLITDVGDQDVVGVSFPSMWMLRVVLLRTFNVNRWQSRLP